MPDSNHKTVEVLGELCDGASFRWLKPIKETAVSFQCIKNLSHTAATIDTDSGALRAATRRTSLSIWILSSAQSRQGNRWNYGGPRKRPRAAYSLQNLNFYPCCGPFGSCVILSVVRFIGTTCFSAKVTCLQESKQLFGSGVKWIRWVVTDLKKLKYYTHFVLIAII